MPTKGLLKMHLNVYEHFDFPFEIEIIEKYLYFKNVVDCILNNTDIILGSALTFNYDSNNKTLWKPVLETATVSCLREIFTVFPTIFQKLNDQLQNQQCKLKYTSLSITYLI